VTVVIDCICRYQHTAAGGWVEQRCGLCGGKWMV